MNLGTMRMPLCLGLLLGMANPLRAAPAASAPAGNASLADLQAKVTRSGRLITSFRVEGVVCAVETNRHWLVVQDNSAVALLELPSLDAPVRPGDRVLIQGENSTLTHGEFGIQVGTAPVVEVDGQHPPTQRFGQVYLKPGRHPLRVEWFNGFMNCTLDLQYAGPGIPRQDIPSSALWRQDARTQKILPGLDFAAYVGDGWQVLPDFKNLTPVTRGFTTNFDLNVRTRQEQAGLVFTGFLAVPTAGVYTFFDRSDDGSRLYLGSSPASYTVAVLSHGSGVPPKNSGLASLPGAGPCWATAEGEVLFATRCGSRLELELANEGMDIPVTVAQGGTLETTGLLHRSLRVTGICQGVGQARRRPLTRMLVPSPAGLEILKAPCAETNLLITAREIRTLQPDEARKSQSVRVRGVVTMITYWFLVLQDATGGVFIQFAAGDTANCPRPGELWEITGRTDPGDFSPIILADSAVCLGAAALPEPIRPVREQLMNGSVDADWVEIQGVLTESTAREMELLTRDGRIRILSKDCYPLPAIPGGGTCGQLPGTAVRVRGVFAAKWDDATHQAQPGKCFLGNPMVTVDELAPRDPFQVPARHAADLLRFTSHIDALTRVKVAGQILFVHPREYILQDGATGLRVRTRERVPLQAGDWVEATGFPQLGGGAILLQEGQLRKTGRAALPAPVAVTPDALVDGHLDATRVQVEARLLSDEVRPGERVLELRAGEIRFLARLPDDGTPAAALQRDSWLRLAGVCAHQPEMPNANGHAFELWLNHPSDIVVLQRGPWWTRNRALTLMGVSSGGLLLTMAWVTMLRRTVGVRTVQLKKEIEERQLAEQHRAMEQERTRVAQDLHDELGAGLAEVGILGSLARNPAIPPDKKDGYLARLTEVSRLLVTGLDEIVWAINPKDDSTGSVSSYLCDYAQEFLGPNAIGCRLDIARSWPGQTLNSHQRHQLFLAFKEALTNIVKHSGATEVWIRMREEEGQLCVTIEDNGKGWPPGSPKKGDGMTNMLARLAKIGGTCAWQSRTDGGCVIRFRLPAEAKRTG